MGNHLDAAYLALGLIFSTSQLLAGPIYQVTDLGTLGGTYTRVNGINAAGQVTGQSATVGGAHAFVYTPGQGMTDLGTFGGNFSGGSSINSSGAVTGFAYGPTDSSARGFVYNPGSGLVDLGSLGGTYTFGIGINDLGMVTGQSTLVPGGFSHAFLYTPGMGMVDLGTLGGSGSSGNAINNAGQVTGTSFLSGNTTPDVFLYSSSTGMVDLGIVGIGLGINASGQTTGQGFNSREAFIYMPGKAPRTLGGVSGNSINNWGVVVGTLGSSRAALFQNGQIIDLNTLIDPGLGTILLDAQGINDSGQIVANGENEDTS